MLNSYLALDVGRARIGVAVANNVALIASPLTTILNNEQAVPEIKKIVAAHNVSELVVGWPRNLQGDSTEQTRYVAGFITMLEQELGLPVVKQDEAVTSVQAEAELQRRGKLYDKGDIDSLSAVYILEDYLTDRVH